MTDARASLFQFLRGPDTLWRFWLSRWRMNRAARRYLRYFDGR